MHLSDKDKILLITQYFYGGSFEYDNNLINCQNACNLHTDKNNLLDLYRCQIEKDLFLKISKDIECILFD